MRYGNKTRAFTLIELLTVVAIIAMLIAVLTVGGNKVRLLGKNLQQKAVFHSMTVGLELFSNDFKDYPGSMARQSTGGWVTGAQHLAESLLGRDGRGFEPRTKWLPPDDAVYNPAQPTDLLYDNTPDSLSRRKGPYMELKYGHALSIHALWGTNKGASQIYDSSANPTTGAERSPVITDVFNKVQAALPNGEVVRAGTPVLYFKANPTARFRVDIARAEVTDPAEAEYSQWAYNYTDNLSILQLPWLADTAAAGLDKHYQDPDGGSKTRQQVFYEKITQPGGDATRGFFKPYNLSSFLLISAGNDGVFGTKDDIVNYD